jgi:putative transposase
MPNYRRWFREGGTYFFTLITYNRKKIFLSDTARSYLHKVIDEVKSLRPFEIPGIVLMPDHCHCIWKLPDDDDDFSTRWQMIKQRFTKVFMARGNHNFAVSASRIKRGEAGVWQRRFWEHLIKDQHDFARHIDYIHYNAVKHGYVRCPHQWEHSSFHRWVRQGIYKSDWMCQCRQNTESPDFTDISQYVGE